jgi:hypothetical protein
LGLFPPHFSQICQGLVNLVYFFKEPAFCFIDSLYIYIFISISLILALIFYNFSASACFVFCLFLFVVVWDVVLGRLFEIFLSFYHMHAWL